MIDSLRAAARAVRAALWRAWQPLSDRATSVPALRQDAASVRTSRGPDLLLLAALALGGLVHPADALAIAVIETDQHLDRHANQ